MKIRISNGSWQRRAIAAFSMVEVTVGMGVVGTLVGALLSGFTSGLFTMQMARENLRATQIMLERMETIRLYSWDQINSTVNGAPFVTPNFTEKYDPTSDKQGITYYGTITITNVPSDFSSSYTDQMKLVIVRLDWKTGNLNRTREFTSYISRCGLQNYIY